MKMNDEMKEQLENERLLALDRLVISNCMNEITLMMLHRTPMSPLMFKAMEKTLNGLCDMWVAMGVVE